MLPEQPLSKEARKQIISIPGPSWREWFYFSFLKVWIVLGFFILDSVVAVGWLQPFNPAALVASVALLVYAEYVLFCVLWYRPPLESKVARKTFQRNWLRPVEYGRWTPEAEIAARGESIYPEPKGPDPKEFL